METTERQDWGEMLEAELTRWQGEHPHTTFAEIEEGVRGMLTHLRPRLLERLAASIPDPGRQCPECGECRAGEEVALPHF